MIYTASDKDVNCPLCGLPHVAVHPNEYCICGSGQEIIKELEAKVEKLSKAICNAVMCSSLAKSDCCSYHVDAIGELLEVWTDFKVKEAQK